MNGRLSLGNSALDVALWVRTGVTLDYIYILDEGPLSIRKHPQHTARLSAVFAGQYTNLVISFYVKHDSNSCQSLQYFGSQRHDAHKVLVA